MIAAIYFILSAFYIAVSDWLVIIWTKAPIEELRLQTAKGIGFVTLTSILLYALTHRLLWRIDRDQRRIEEQQEALFRAERRAAVRLMAQALAHDMNNVLTVGLANVELLRARGKLDESGREMLGDIQQSFERLHDLTRRMRDLERDPQIQPKTTVDLVAVAKDVIQLMRRHPAMDGKELALAGPGRLVVDGYPPLFYELLHNLLLNAAEATPQGGRIEICLRQGESAVTLEVHDTGPGVPAEKRTQIFQPFFTTKAGGMGLGLLSAKAAAKAHGGSIEVADSPLGGACFRVTLPA